MFVTHTSAIVLVLDKNDVEKPDDSEKTVGHKKQSTNT